MLSHFICAQDLTKQDHDNMLEQVVEVLVYSYR